MEIAAVMLARSVAFLETIDLNPRGTLFMPQVAGLISQRFNFQKSPLNPTIETKKKGEKESSDFIFEKGFFNGVSLEKLTISNDGIVIDVRSSTSDAKALILDSLEWLSSEVGLSYKPEMIARWAYVSQLTFYSKVDILKPNSAVDRLKHRVTKSVSVIHGDEFPFEPTALALDFDRSLQKRGFVRFSIQRRAETSFSENKYFSDAPLETDEHIAILEAFETDMKELNR